MMKKLIALLMVLIMVLAMNAGALAATTGDTDVTFAIDDTQISITVPTTIPATVTASTGALSFPAATACQLENKSAFGLKVTSIACTPETGWTLASTAGSTDDTIVATIKAGSGTAVALVETSPTISGSEWNMTADGVTGDTIDLTLAGSIANAGAATQALTTSASPAFTITFTVAAGAY